MKESDLAACHEWLKQGLACLARGKEWTIHYDDPPRYGVHLAPPRVTRRMPWKPATTVLKQIVFEEAVPVFLRSLLVCKRKDYGRLFWRRGRQKYCSPRCGGRERTGKWRRGHPEHTAKARESRRETYKRKQRERTSPNVRVGRPPKVL
jgi:hypothetical protein